MRSALAWSLLFGSAAAAANVAGGLAVVARREWNERFLKYFLGLGAGFMLAATFLRMLPESMRLTDRAPLLFLGGYFLVHFFEHTVAPHFHFGEERHDEVMMNPAVGISALAGLTIHTFFDGVSIASGFLVSVPLGLLIFCAVILHKIPEGVTVASIALASGHGKRGALAASFILAAATLAGFLATATFAFLKRRVRRPRPCDLAPHPVFRVRAPDRFSFPSGHTINAFAIGGVLAWEWPVLAPALGLLAGGIGASRVILGLHYASDVAAGAILGVTIAGAVCVLLLR